MRVARDAVVRDDNADDAVDDSERDAGTSDDADQRAGWGGG